MYRRQVLGTFRHLAPCFPASCFSLLTQTSSQQTVTSLPCWGVFCFSTSAHAAFPVVKFPLAQTGEGIAECELLKWTVKEGDKVKRFEKICEVQSDKASIEITSPYDGTVTSLPHQIGDVIQVGKTLIEIDVENSDLAGSTEPVPNPGAAEKEGQEKKIEQQKAEKVLASPAVRLLAKENDVDLADVTPTGTGNRVTKEDVQHFLQIGQAPSQESSQDKIPIRGFRKGMLKSMTASLSIPHFHFSDDVDMTALLRLKAQLADERLLRGLKLTYLPIIIKALSAALSEFPEVNSRLSPDATEILLHKQHNVGVAIATDDGLAVPNVKNVQDKSIAQIAQELHELRGDALMNALKPEALEGGTISVSNIGSLGGCYSSPIVLPPQVAIVAIGKMRRVLESQNRSGTDHDVTDVTSKPLMPFSWGADHRVLDGATLVQFSNRWKQLLEEPERLMCFLK